MLGTASVALKVSDSVQATHHVWGDLCGGAQALLYANYKYRHCEQVSKLCQLSLASDLFGLPLCNVHEGLSICWSLSKNTRRSISMKEMA